LNLSPDTTRKTFARLIKKVWAKQWKPIPMIHHQKKQKTSLTL